MRPGFICKSGARLLSSLLTATLWSSFLRSSLLTALLRSSFLSSSFLTALLRSSFLSSSLLTALLRSSSFLSSSLLTALLRSSSLNSSLLTALLWRCSLRSSSFLTTLCSHVDFLSKWFDPSPNLFRANRDSNYIIFPLFCRKNASACRHDFFWVLCFLEKIFDEKDVFLRVNSAFFGNFTILSIF